LVAALLGGRLAAAGGPSGLVVAGTAFVGDGRPADLAVVHDGTGYDGQFVYRMALDPFPDEPTAYGITLDNPPYRAQRVGLPLLANALTHAGIPPSWALVVVNVLALLAATAAAAALARRYGRHALWGVAVGLSPALVVAFTRDLTEPLATAFLLAGLVALPRHRPAAAAAFTAAVLTRETTLAFLAGLGLYELARLARRRPEALRNAATLVVPLAAAVAWQLHLRGVWGELPVSSTEAGGLGAPFAQTARALFAHADLTAWSTRDALLEILWLAERLALAAFLVYAATRARTAGAMGAAYAVAALLATSTAWHRDVAFLRASNEAIVAGLLVLLATGTRKPLIATAAASGGLAVLYGALL
jgi:hypothetical protein